MKIVPSRTVNDVNDVNDWNVQRSIDEMDHALVAMADAALSGEDAIKEVAARSFSVFTAGRHANVLERSGDGWKYADNWSNVEPPLAQILNNLWSPAAVCFAEDIGVLVPVTTRSVAVLLRGSMISKDRWPDLKILATAFRLALGSAIQRRRKNDAVDEIRGFQQITHRILRAGELGDILFAICQETKRILSAYMCGIFLLDHEKMVMRECIGNQTRSILKIQLDRGQGLAGRIFETGVHCLVNDYLTSEILTQENSDLVRAEHIRSAVGTPLYVNDQLIGVLEVWRRRQSSFKEQDVRRIGTLASLAGIAINNAELYERQKSDTQLLVAANKKMEQQDILNRKSAEITDAVLQALLVSGGLTAIVCLVANYTDMQMIFLNCELEVKATSSPTIWFEECRSFIQQAIAKNRSHQATGPLTLQLSDSWVYLRPVITGDDHIGWVCARCREKSTHFQEIAVGLASMASALTYLEERAVARARVETESETLWGLLEGTGNVAQAAVIRAKQLRIDLSGALRVIHCTAEGSDEHGHAEKPSEEALDSTLRQVRQILERGLSHSGLLRLMAERGSLFAAIVEDKGGEQIKAIVRSIGAEMARQVSWLRPIWGASAGHHKLGDLSAAHDEAGTATKLVRKLGFGVNIAVHEDMGVIGLLLKVRSDAGLGEFVRNILSRVISYDSKHHSVLIRTVRAYFKSNCSLHDASLQLHVHEKTVRYRLTQFQNLTDMDLNIHEHRMLVHLAIGMYSIAIDDGNEHPESMTPDRRRPPLPAISC